MSSESVKQEEAEMYAFELADEEFGGREVKILLKTIALFGIFMVIVTSTCIWMMDFGKNSTFSTIMGKNESVKEIPTAPK